MNRLDPALPRAGRWPGTLPWLVAGAIFLMALAVAGALALSAAGTTLHRAATGALLVQIADADPARRDATAARVLARLRTDRAVAAARRVPRGEIAALLAPYLGPADLAALPVPAMIDVTLAPGGAAARITQLVGSLPTVTVSSEAETLTPLARLVAALRSLALTIVLLAASATALGTAIAARAVLAAHDPTIAILHGLGAEDAQVAALIARRAMRDAAIGAVIGLAAALAAIVVIAARLTAVGLATAPAWPDWAALAAPPLGAVLVAGLTARLTAVRSLRRMP